jgi:hypothetical protein
VIDYLHWDHFGDFALNKKCWPDPAAMIQELDSLDIRAMISIWPFVQSGDVYGHDYNATGKSTNFDAMHAGNMLVQVYTDTGSQTDRQTPFDTATKAFSGVQMFIVHIVEPSDIADMCVRLAHRTLRPASRPRSSAHRFGKAAPSTSHPNLSQPVRPGAQPVAAILR